MSQTTTLQEYTDSRGVQLGIDRDKGIITGVKILGLASRNGRTYLKETAVRASSLYEGAKVNVNHPNGNPSSPRDYRDRIGVIHNVRIGPGESGLFGDFHANPKHALFEQLAWDAEHSPESVGFSHNVEAKTRRKGNQLIVEEITRVQSVDLVADPATSRGLFEQSETPEEKEADVENITLEQLQADQPALVKAIGKAALQEQADSAEAKAQTARVKELETKLTEQEKLVDEFKAKEKLAEQEAAKVKAAAELKETVDKELAEAKLPEPLVTDVFRKTLFAAKDADERQALIEDRAALKATVKPQSREQTLAEHEGASAFTDVKSFVAAIT